VLDPGHPEAATAFVTSRLDKLFAEFDGVRLDHPHGFICPWVYDTNSPDPQQAVQAGARLFESPVLPDHPALARFAIPRADQLNPDPRTARHADDWVVQLEPEQVRRYGRLMDAIVASARRHGQGAGSLACEVLSTCPYPLARVLAQHGLGRFRITQKANLHRADDVYRSEHAQPGDWAMIGNHDTPTLWRLLDDWERAGSRGERADYLAWRLAPQEHRRERLARDLRASPGLLAQAMLADLLACRARNVLVFFTDAFGLRESYNQGGVVAPDNWTLRLTADYAQAYGDRLADARALNLPLALALALRARGDEITRAQPGLVGRLDALACRSGAR
jgi:4-alpha-glucanotransferase